jgi:SAM-dependent methyltransferase
MSENIEDLFPIVGNFDLIQATDNVEFSTILDVGLGKGGASLYFSQKGKTVTAIGLDIQSYNIDSRVLKNKNILIQEGLFEDYVSEEKFDAILLSHVLEHTQNVGIFLKKVYNLLNKDGWLFVMVPPYKNYIVGGHVSNGWNMAQLIYNLLLSGFNVKEGHFITYGYNICAFVRKSDLKLPLLRMDNGDLESLKHFMPIEFKQNSYAKVRSINWFDSFNPILYKYPDSFNEEYHCILQIYDFCLTLDKNKKYILYGYGSVGKLIYPLIKDNIVGIYDVNISEKVTKRIEFKDINSTSNVIITAFRYNDEIEQILKIRKCNIFKIYP